MVSRSLPILSGGMQSLTSALGAFQTETRAVYADAQAGR